MMNIKKIILLLMLMTYVTSSAIAATKSNEIELKAGIQNPTNGKRVPAAPVVEATHTGNFVHLFFLCNVGNITITITSETGETMYLLSTATDYGVSEMIDTYGFAEGNYLITITNAGGMWLQGEFEI